MPAGEIANRAGAATISRCHPFASPLETSLNGSRHERLDRNQPNPTPLISDGG